MMCEKEGFISHVIKGSKKSDRSRSETLPLSHINNQRLSYHTDETCDSQKPILAEIHGNARHPKLSKAQTSQQQVSPTDEEIDCLLQKTGFLDEKGWSKSLGGNFMRASVVSFTVMCCLLAMLNGALVAGYVSSVITTIEKRFDIGSFYSGMVAASVEMGGAASVIFVSYFGSSRHIPGWIGLGAALTGFGALVFTLPHVMAPAYTVTGGLNSSTGTDSICRPKQVQNLPISSSLVSGVYSVAVDPLCDAKLSSPLFYVLILIVAQLLIGIGGSPLYTLGTTYIDNHVSRMKAPSYIAFIYACGVFGPIAGFGLGALMLQYYVDLLTFDITALNLTPNNPKWVGAWWGGFVFIGALLLLVSVPFYGFPKILVSELKMLAKQDRQKFFSLMEVFNSSQSSEHPLRPPPLVETSKAKLDPVVGDKSSYGKNIRDIPGALLKIFKNPVYLVTSLGICCEVSVVSGFVFFLPKYLESEFGASKIMASLLTGGIAIPGAVIGILMGGHCLRHCQLTSKGAIQLTLALNSIALAGFGLFFVLGCDNVKIAGVTVPYDNHSHYNSLNGYVSVNSFNLSSSCNRHCSCDDNNLDLVCGADEVMFFSPCHAGCMQVGSSNPAEQNYTNCSCTREYDSDGTEVVEIPGKTLWVRSASGGACQHVCGTLIPFMVMLFIMTFVIAGTQMPLLMVTIRSVGEQEKALALGLQFVMLRLFAYIPAPIMYGWQIDQTCIFWTKTCGTLGNCLVYDLVQLRYKFVGISFAYKFFAATFYLSIWIILWMRHDKTLKDGDAESSKRMSLVIVEEPNVLCPTLDFQPPPPSEAKTKGTQDADNSFKKSYESMGAYSAASRSAVEGESSERDESVETTLDALDCGEVSKDGETCDEASLKVMKQFNSFPLIDDDDDLEGKVDNRRRNASQQVSERSANFQDSFHKFPTPAEAVRVGREATESSW